MAVTNPSPLAGPPLPSSAVDKANPLLRAPLTQTSGLWKYLNNLRNPQQTPSPVDNQWREDGSEPTRGLSGLTRAGLWKETQPRSLSRSSHVLMSRHSLGRTM